MSPYPIFDSHCHLDAEQFDADRAEVVRRAVDAGLAGVVIPATDRASCDKAVSLLDRLDGLPAYAAVGVHPHEAKAVDERDMAAIEALSEREGVVAIRETGLDYHYDFSPPEVQRASLRAHVQLAVRRRLPLVLHCRNAEADLLAILREEGASAGVVHCFTGEWETAEQLLDLGFHIGFTGIVTFRNAEALREVVRRVPLDRILLETDAPYLAPIPYRGKRNEPSFLPRVAETVALLHSLTPSETARAAMENTFRCFRL
jgi:TatD DNase family protein